MVSAASLGHNGSPKSLPVFCRRLLEVPRLLLVVDTIEDAAALPLALYDDGKALGKGLILKASESFIKGLK